MCSKVMLVEDNTALNRSLQRLLRKEGFSVTAAFNTEEARRLSSEELSSEEQPDIVLLDTESNQISCSDRTIPI